MKNRAINALLEMGMPADIKGFEYIIDIMLMYGDENVRYGGIMKTYELVAEKRNTTVSRVERAIRHAFKIVFDKGNLEAVKKYLSFGNTANGNLLHVLYLRLEQESEEENAD